MKEFGSKRNKLLCATAATAMLALAGCGSPQSANTMSLYGKDTDEDTRARVDRLVAYCQKLSKAGDFYLSSGMCARAHELDPTNPLPLFVMAENFERFDKNDHAIRAYQTLLDNQPKNSEASYRLAKIQLDYERERFSDKGIKGEEKQRLDQLRVELAKFAQLKPKALPRA